MPVATLGGLDSKTTQRLLQQNFIHHDNSPKLFEFNVWQL
jgi:hypothetical protein